MRQSSCFLCLSSVEFVPRDEALGIDMINASSDVGVSLESILVHESIACHRFVTSNVPVDNSDGWKRYN